MSNELRQEFQELEAKLLASRIAKHAKLLQQARRKLHWSDLSMLLAGLLLLLPTAQRGRRGDRGAQGQAREGANS